MAHPNEAILRRGDEALGRGDMEAFWADFADDVVVHVAGRSALAGDHKGKVEAQVLFGRFMEALGEGPQIETHDILASGDHGVTLQTYRGERDGRRVELHGTAVYHFTAGKISEAWFLDLDPYTADAWYDAGLA